MTTVGERLARLEVQMSNTSDDLTETRQALRRATDQIETLTTTLNAVLNQGRGVRIVFNILTAIGGLGWVLGILSFFQQMRG